MSEKTLKMPMRPSLAEQTNGLSRARKREFERLQAHLKATFDSLAHESFKTPECRVLTAILNAAVAYNRSPETYRRNFCDLARLAKRVSKTPEDFLTGRTTARGTDRGDAPRLTERMAARLSPQTKEKFDEAMRLFKERHEAAGINEFIDRAATRYLRDGRI